MSQEPFEFSTLSPVERMQLADLLYDSAMREIDAMTPTLTSDQLADVDRRIAAIDAGTARPQLWETLRRDLEPRA